MYDDDVSPLTIGGGAKHYKVAKYPTKNIKTPIVLVYGGSDSLVDIQVMLKELPKHTVAQEVCRLDGPNDSMTNAAFTDTTFRTSGLSLG